MKEIIDLPVAGALVAASPDAILVTDQQGSVLFVNSRAVMLTGYMEEELRHKHIGELLDTAASNLPAVGGLTESVSAGKKSWVKHKHGALVPVEISTARSPGNLQVWVLLDITGQLKAEEEISRLNDRFTLVSKATNEGIWDWDIVQNNLSGNNNLINLLSPDAHENGLPFETWTRRIHPDEREQVKNHIDHAVETGVDYWQAEYRYLLPSGSYGNFYNRAYIIRDKGGRAVRMVGVMTDLTNIKKVEQELQLSQEKFSKAFINNVAGVAIWDESGSFVDVNYAFARMIEFSKHEIIGKTSSQLGLISEERRLDLINELALNGTIANFEIQITTKSGRTITALSYLSNIEVNGRVQRLTTFFDITEKKRVTEKLEQSEMHYRLLFNATPLPAWVIDNETHQYLNVNEAAIRHYGYSREEFLTMNVMKLHPPSQLERFLERIANSSKPYVGNQGIWQHLKKDGTIIFVEIVSHEISYERKHARLALANDITEKLKMEREMEQVNKELRSLTMHLQEVREEERIHIAREIHDELGQQLTGLKMYVHSLNKKLVTEDEMIRNKLTDILELVDDTIRSVRKLATTLRPSMLDDLGLVAAMEWLSQEVEKRSEIRIAFHAGIDAAAISDGIKTGLFRIYQEALTNVVRHASAQQINSRLLFENNYIRLEVEDDGRGFVPELKQAKTFGLLGMKERTNKLGGTFELISAPGKGTRILIAIPL